MSRPDKDSRDHTPGQPDRAAGLGAGHGPGPVSLTEQELSALAAAAQAFGQTANLDDAFERLADAVKAVIPFDRMTIYLMDTDQEKLTCRFISGLEIPGRWTGQTIPLHGTLSGMVALSGRTRLESHCGHEVVKQFPRSAPVIFAGIKSILCVPLQVANQGIGTFLFQAKKAGAFGAAHARAAELLAGLVAGAIAGSIQSDEIKRSAAENAAQAESRALIAELAQTVTSTPGTDAAYQQFAEKLKGLIPWDSITIATVLEDGANFGVLFADGITIPQRIKGDRLSMRRSLTASVIEARQPRIINAGTKNQAAEILAEFPSLAPWLTAGLSSFLAVPLSLKNSVAGILHMACLRPDQYTVRHLSIAKLLAAPVATAIQGQILAQTREEKAAESAHLSRIAATLSSSLKIEELFESFAKIARNLIPWDRVVINEFDQRHNSDNRIYISGTSVPEGPLGSSFPVAGTFTKHVVDLGIPVRLHVREGTQLERIKKEFPRMLNPIDSGLRSYIATPIISSGIAIGALHFQTIAADAYTQHHEELMTQVAAYLSSAMANSQLHRRIADQSAVSRKIAHLGRIFSSAVDPRDVLPEFFEELASLMPLDRLAITSRHPDGDAMDLKYVAGLPIPGWNELERVWRPGKEKRRSLMSAEGRILPSPEIAKATRETDEGRALAYEAGIRSGMHVPLIAGGRVVGVFYVKSTLTDVYKEHHLQLLEQVAAQVAGVVAATERHQQAVAVALEQQRLIKAEADRKVITQRAEVMRSIVSQVGHELRTPVTVVMAFAGLLKKNRSGNLTEDQIEKLEIMQRNGRRLADLIDELLDVSRMTDGGHSLELREVDAVWAVRQTKVDLAPIVSKRRQTLTLITPGKPLTVRIDPMRFSQVITGLVSNASAFSPEDTKIGIRVRADHGSLLLTVEDRGPGIPREERERVFELFHRPDNETTRTVPGIGVGLYAARSLTEAMGGKIRIDPDYDAGTRVVIELPLVESARSLEGRVA